jgi:two-component system, sensor histidine kinase and response regulator
MAPEDMQVVLDVPDLLVRLQNDRELLVELSEILKTEYPTHLRSLEQAVSGEDMKTVERTGHALKGMFAALSAARAASAASQLEPTGRKGDKLGLRNALTILESEAAALLIELDRCLEAAKNEDSHR